VAVRLLGRLRPLLVATAGVRDVSEGRPDVDEAGVILSALEQRQRRPCTRLQLVRREFGELCPPLLDDNAGDCLAGFVAGVAGALRGSLLSLRLAEASDAPRRDRARAGRRGGAVA